MTIYRQGAALSTWKGIFVICPRLEFDGTQYTANAQQVADMYTFSKLLPKQVLLYSDGMLALRLHVVEYPGFWTVFRHEGVGGHASHIAMAEQVDEGLALIGIRRIAYDHAMIMQAGEPLNNLFSGVSSQYAAGSHAWFGVNDEPDFVANNYNGPIHEFEHGLFAYHNIYYGTTTPDLDQPFLYEFSDGTPFPVGINADSINHAYMTRTARRISDGVLVGCGAAEYADGPPRKLQPE